MSKRTLFWLIASAIMAFFYIAASYSGGGVCSTLDFTKWGRLSKIYSYYSRCGVTPRLAVLLIGLVPSLVLVYFAEKGQPRFTDGTVGSETTGRMTIAVTSERHDSLPPSNC